MSMTSTECHVLTCTDCATSLLVHHPLDESTCPICISTNVERTNASDKPFLAERLQPFRHQKKNLPALFKTFTRGARFRCRDLHPSLLAQRAQPLFIPSWLVDATLEGHWSAEAGYNYQVQSSVDVFHKGQWQTEIVEETRVRFDDRVGTLHRRYNDQHVSALESDMPHGAVLSQISNHSDAPAFELSQWEQISIVLPTRTEEFAKEDAQRADRIWRSSHRTADQALRH